MSDLGDLKLLQIRYATVLLKKKNKEDYEPTGKRNGVNLTT